MKDKKIIFNIAGGAGKNIMATALVKTLAKKYSEYSILVTSPYDSIWQKNPHVEKIIDLEKTPGFFESYVKSGVESGEKNGEEKDIVKLFLQDPYHTDDFIHQKKNLIDIWADLCEIKVEDKKPELFFSEEENKNVKEKLKRTGLIGDKPLFMIQTNGGYINQAFPISWARDLPLSTAQQVVDHMKKEGYNIIHFRRDNQWSLEGAVRPEFTLREFLCAIQFTDKRLFIDSLPQHAAAAFNLPSTVVWIANTPKVFGYEIHKNIIPKLPTEFRHLTDSYIEKYNIWGTLHEHPYKTDQIFDFDEIIDSLN